MGKLSALKSERVVERWLAERHQLIVAFYELCTLKPFKYPKIIQPLLENFLSKLIDYVSAGQFEVFEIIFEASSDRAHTGKKLDSTLMQRLLRTTNFALEFQDKYSKPDHTLADLETDLSALGEQFAIRLDCEEELIRLYIDATDWLNKRSKKPTISLD